MKYPLFLTSKKASPNSQASRLYLKLRAKFTVSFFILIFIPFVIFAVFMLLNFRGTLEGNIYEMNLIGIEQQKSGLLNAIKDLEYALDSAASDKGLDALASAGALKIAGSSSQEFEKAVRSYLTPGEAAKLSGAYLIKGDRVVASYQKSGYKATISKPSSQDWYKRASSKPDEAVIIGASQRFFEAGSSATVFSMAESLGTPTAASPEDTGASRAVLLFDFDYNLLSDIMSSQEALKKGITSIVSDNSGNVIYSIEPGSLSVALDPDLAGYTAEGTQGFRHISYRGASQYLTYEKFADPPWTFITLMPTGDATLGINPLGNPLILLLIILIPLIMLLFLAASTGLLRPINELTAVISGYEGNTGGPSPDQRQQGSADPHSLPHNRLAYERISSVSEIDYLINKVYDIRLKQKEAELNSLQNQINPHFLYNTLESIRGAALHHGIQEIAAMSKALSLLFRYSISDMVLVSIKEEIQHLENYMSIQNFRYEDKFDLLYSIPPELYSYKILKLTLQPLIENSIKHGLEMKLGRGSIKIEMLCLENNIKINISDDGIGMPPKKIEELNRALARDEYSSGTDSSDRTGTGIGVRNVNSRIKLYFGSQYGLKFRDVPVGTTVELTLPAVRGNS